MNDDGIARFLSLSIPRATANCWLSPRSGTPETPSRHLLPANLRSIAVTGGLRHPHGHALVPIVAPVRVDESLIILVKLFEGLPCALPAWRNIRPRSSYVFLGSKQHLGAYPRHLTL